MSTWEDFEVQCTGYLNNKFGAYANFTHQGGSNSTVPDILVTNSKGNFYIEAKHSPAQCGQFVLLPNIEKRCFEYSPLNVNYINDYAIAIMNHMNNDFDSFREAGTSGKDIIMHNGPTIFSNWIIKNYLEKNVKFIITNNYTILPLEQFSNYFDVSAKYRIKRSGSGNVGASRISPVQDYIVSLGFPITRFKVCGDKLYASSFHNLHNQRFVFQGNEYMFSLREDMYELRKLSNTYNANVIFSINLKNSLPGITEREFLGYL